MSGAYFQDMMCFSDPDKGLYGDCFRCCVAAVLGLPAQRVPHFVQVAHDAEEPWQFVVNAWLRDHYHAFLLSIDIPNSLLYDVYAEAADLHIIAGISPRDPAVMHAVVGQHGKMVFDPHPSRAGLAKPLMWEFIVPCTPRTLGKRHA